MDAVPAFFHALHPKKQFTGSHHKPVSLDWTAVCTGSSAWAWLALRCTITAGWLAGEGLRHICTLSCHHLPCKKAAAFMEGRGWVSQEFVRYTSANGDRSPKLCMQPASGCDWKQQNEYCWERKSGQEPISSGSSEIQDLPDNQQSRPQTQIQAVTSEAIQHQFVGVVMVD